MIWILFEWEHPLHSLEQWSIARREKLEQQAATYQMP
jgi:hypothetical protein